MDQTAYQCGWCGLVFYQTGPDDVVLVSVAVVEEGDPVPADRVVHECPTGPAA